MTEHIALRADAGAALGAGHVVRVLSLAQELRRGGAQPVLLGNLGGVAWVAEFAANAGVEVYTGDFEGAGLRRAVQELRATALVVDSYSVAASSVAEVRDAGTPVLAIVDYETRGLSADVFVDQNLAANASALTVPAGARVLAGPEFAIIRDDIVQHRPVTAPTYSDASGLAVLVLMGGTDAAGLAARLAACVLATGAHVNLVVVTSEHSVQAELAQVALGSGQSLRTIAPSTNIVDEIINADVVVSAAGTSVLELMCLGKPAALVCVAENQEPNYTRATSSGLAFALGTTDSVSGAADQTTSALARLFADRSLRQELATSAWHAVDGLGRQRIARALAEIGVLGSGRAH